MIVASGFDLVCWGLIGCVVGVVVFLWAFCGIWWMLVICAWSFCYVGRTVLGLLNWLVVLAVLLLVDLFWGLVIVVWCCGLCCFGVACLCCGYCRLLCCDVGALVWLCCFDLWVCVLFWFELLVWWLTASIWFSVVWVVGYGYLGLLLAGFA